MSSHEKVIFYSQMGALEGVVFQVQSKKWFYCTSAV